MKRINFLNKLYKEKKIQFNEPSKELKKAYLQRSEESLSSAKALMKLGNLKDSVALAYYSMYHCLLALLFRVGIKSENHAASIIMLKEIFDLDNLSISKAKSDRMDKQYYVDFEVSQEETKQSIIVAEEFIANLRDYMERLTEEGIEEFKKKARKVIGFEKIR